jgi:hypothetical protein
VPEATPYPPSAPDDGIACPQCGDLAQVRKLTAIVSEGTTFTASQSSTSGVGYQFGPAGGLNVRTGGIASKGTAQTHLSQQLAPPPTPTEASGCFGGTTASRDRVKVERWRRKVQHWEKLYYCGRCDVVFDPEARRYTRKDIWREALATD